MRRSPRSAAMSAPVSYGDAHAAAMKRNPYLRGSITGAGTFLGGVLLTLPFLIPHYRAALGAVSYLCWAGRQHADLLRETADSS
jgi:hypothetical protein